MTKVLSMLLRPHSTNSPLVQRHSPRPRTCDILQLSNLFTLPETTSATVVNGLIVSTGRLMLSFPKSRQVVKAWVSHFKQRSTSVKKRLEILRLHRPILHRLLLH